MNGSQTSWADSYFFALRSRPRISTLALDLGARDRWSRSVVEIGGRDRWSRSAIELDVGLEHLTDHRQRRGRRYRHRALVMALMLGMVAALRSLRQVEAYTEMLSYDMRRATGIPHRISDSKLQDELLSMESQQLREALHRQVKAEHRRGNLVPSRLRIGLVAIDGKCLAKLDDWGHWDVQAVRPTGETP